MSEQLSLLGAARASDPVSSHEAAASCDAKNQRQRVLEFMAAHPSWSITADDLVDASLGSVQRNVWSSRLSQLKTLGLVRCVGYASPNGRRVQAFSLTGEGARRAAA